MNMSIYNYFAPANTFDNLLERNKSLLEENKRLKIKLKAFQNQKSNNLNMKNNYEKEDIDDTEVGNNKDDNQMDIDDSPQSNSPLIKRKSYSIISKYRILQELKNNKTSEIAKKYNIPISTFKRWKKNEEKYKEQILIKEGNKQRLIGGGRKIMDPEYELFWVNWIKSEREKKTKLVILVLLNLQKKIIKEIL